MIPAYEDALSKRYDERFPAVAAMRVLSPANLAYFLSGTRRISYDMVLKSMYWTGLDLNKNYRETSQRALAAAYSRKGV